MPSPPQPIVARAILEWSEDDAGDAIAHLDCGHRRHVRHRPPMSDYAWVRDPAQRARRVGAPLECDRCARRELPPDAQVYKVTAVFEGPTIPPGLLHAHSLATGTWGRLRIERGRATLRFEHAPHDLIDASAECPAIIPPTLRHVLIPDRDDPPCFRVEFLRVARA